MFKKIIKWHENKNLVKANVTQVLYELSVTDPASDEYAKLVEHLHELEDILEKEKFKLPIDLKLDLGQVIAAGTTLIVVSGILIFEKDGVITSKALAWAPKLIK
jgi:hypothetical protein